jgi:hypothetical protein
MITIITQIYTTAQQKPPVFNPRGWPSMF